MTLDELKEAVKEAEMPAFTAKQIADWVYNKRVRSIDEMSNISLKNREKLNGLFEVGFKAPSDAARSVDGTVKYLYEVENGHFVEAVYIPDGDFAFEERDVISMVTTHRTAVSFFKKMESSRKRF